MFLVRTVYTVSSILLGFSSKEKAQWREVSFSYTKLSALMPLLHASRTEII